MSKKLHDRLVRLERALPELPAKTHPYWEQFHRRVRIYRLYEAWQKGEIEKPELADPRDLAEWEDMETTMRIAKKVVARRAKAEGRYLQADEWYSDEEGE